MLGIVQAGRTFQLVTFLSFSAALLISIRLAKNGKRHELRSIPGFEALGESVGRAAEMGRPVHFTPGYYSLSLEMMAGLQALKATAGLVAKYHSQLIATTGGGDTYAVADALVKQSFAEVGEPEMYRADTVRYLADNQWAFSSGVMGIIAREKVATNIMIGQFAAESLVLSEAGYSVGAMQIAGTTAVSQLPFFIAACDYVVIGEELFAAEAYFTQNASSLGYLHGQDIARALSIGLLVAGVLARAFNSEFVANLTRK